MTTLHESLSAYQTARNITTPGKLAAMLYFSHLAREQGIPLDPTTFRTEGPGQVKGLGVAAVQKILESYGIERTLAHEGGRTSRGNLGSLEHYATFLEQLKDEGLANTAEIERWWVDRIQDYWASKPFELRYDTSKSLRAMVQDLLAQARKRQDENPGTMYAGAVLQHLVGAKLDLILPAGTIEHFGSSVNDASNKRGGDFVIDEVVIHVTTAPVEALMDKCKANLAAGLSPVIVTVHDSMGGAEFLARTKDIEGRVDILEAEQFIATNILELSKFESVYRKITVRKLIDKYNAIVDACETDPSLRVEMG